METFAVIVAGGSGTRMGGSVPKQFLKIRNEPIILHTARSFSTAFPAIQLVLVFPQAYINTGKDLFKNFPAAKHPVFVTGGDTRFHSVKNGLDSVPENAIVFVHDAVRCLVSNDLIRRCFANASENGSAIPVVPVRDSLRILNDDNDSSVLDRNKVRAVQTPQTFQAGLIKNAFSLPYHPSFTDEATVFEAAGLKVSLIAGEENNIKVTYPADLDFAESVLNRLSK